MRATVAKAIRKQVKKRYKTNWLEYVQAICQWPLRARLRFCRDILFHAKRYRPKGEK